MRVLVYLCVDLCMWLAVFEVGLIFSVRCALTARVNMHMILHRQWDNNILAHNATEARRLTVVTQKPDPCSHSHVNKNLLIHRLTHIFKALGDK